MIEVVVSGAVVRAGRIRLEPDASLSTALWAAGGLAYRSHAVPEGELVLRRRPPSSRTVSVYRWRIFDGSSEAWRAFPLEQHDVVVFTWLLRSASAPT